MKNLILLSFVIICFLPLMSSGMGGKPTRKQLERERKNQDKIWRACQDFEVKNTENRNPVGRLCNKTCIDRKIVNGGCSQWKINIKNFTSKEDFMFFRNAGFIFIDEDLL